MKQKRLSMLAGLAFSVLYLALRPEPAIAGVCDDGYFACKQACEESQSCQSSFHCWCGYLSCKNEPLPAGCNDQ